MSVTLAEIRLRQYAVEGLRFAVGREETTDFLEDLDKLREHEALGWKTANDLDDDVTKLQQRITELIAALVKYGEHFPDCYRNRSDKHGDVSECTCGLEAVFPDGVRWNVDRCHYEEAVCLGCAKPSRIGDCGCPAGTGWRRWNGATNA